MSVRLQARRGRGAAVTLVAVLAAGGLLLTGPFGAAAGAEAAPDPETPVAVAPVFPKVDFKLAADGMPCRKETARREGAVKNSNALKDLYDVVVAAAEGRRVAERRAGPRLAARGRAGEAG